MHDGRLVGRFELETKHRKPVDGIRYRSSRNGRTCVVLFFGHEECIAKVKFRRGERAMIFDQKSLRTKKVGKTIKVVTRARRKR